MRPVSVVLQGPVDWEPVYPTGLPVTYHSIRRCRELLPGCEIILSTWKGEVVDLLEADRVIFNDDPGGQASKIPNGVTNNVNRQIVNTIAGLREAKNDLVLKLRSDIVLTGRRFLDRFHALAPPPKESRIFERRIVSNNLSSRNPRHFPQTPLPYHPSDHAHFGLKSDLFTFWDVPLQTTEDADWFLHRDRPDGFRLHETSRLAPEQHICTNAFSKVQPIMALDHYADGRAIEESERLMLANFEFIPDAKFAIFFWKYHNPYHAQFEYMRYPANWKGKPPRSRFQRLLNR